MEKKEAKEMCLELRAKGKGWEFCRKKLTRQGFRTKTGKAYNSAQGLRAALGIDYATKKPKNITKQTVAKHSKIGLEEKIKALLSLEGFTKDERVRMIGVLV